MKELGENFSKSENGNFEVMGSANGPSGQSALLIGCKADPNGARPELTEYLAGIKRQGGFKEFAGFVLKKMY